MNPKPDVSQPGFDVLERSSIRCEGVQLMDSAKHIDKIHAVERAYAARRRTDQSPARARMSTDTAPGQSAGR